jgi:hypothetical protein
MNFNLDALPKFAIRPRSAGLAASWLFFFLAMPSTGGGAPASGAGPPITNSPGMKFVATPATNLLICVWLTRKERAAGRLETGRR